MTYLAVIVVCLLALALMARNLLAIRAMPEGKTKMVGLAQIIRDGADVFMKTEYKVITPSVVVVAILSLVFVEKLSAITVLFGALMSTAACITGMKGATYANVRVAHTAHTTRRLPDTTKVALIGGSISGLAVQGFELLGVAIILLVYGGVSPEATGTGLLAVARCNPTIQGVVSYSLGCSIVAMFNRVAGGNYTKAADISADSVAKVRHGLPEDDPRIPNVMADFIGDNVNDILANCSDLGESFVATISASILIADFVCRMIGNYLMLTPLVDYAMMLAGGGLLSCTVCILFMMFHKLGNDPAKELDLVTTVSALMTIALSVLASYVLFRDNAAILPEFRMGWISPAAASCLGVLSGVGIGKLTEYYTSMDYKPVKRIAHSCIEGAAFGVTRNDAVGSRSCLPPMAMIAIALILAYQCAGFYGIAAAAAGMLSFVAATVSIDAFGPIADNAGGLAEAAGLPEEVRMITDRLDAVGNTTAAIGKGFAIGSAAFATVSLIMAYVSSYATGAPVLNAVNPSVVAGMLIAGGLIEYFCGLLTDNTIDSAEKMADEGESQLDRILEGAAQPDYNRCIELAAKEALRKMLSPSIIAILAAIVGGLVLGKEALGGILLGAAIVAVSRALFMGNSGGAGDNAKKSIEMGQVPGHKKGSEAHKAAVVCDTIGDTRKDVVGVALDIFIKMMSTVANMMVPLLKAVR